MRTSKHFFTKIGLAAMMLFSVLLHVDLLGNVPDSQDAGQLFKNHEKAVWASDSENQLLLANRQVGIQIIQGSKGFYLSRIYGIDTGQDFLASSSAKTPSKLWQLNMRADNGRDTKAIIITSQDGGALSKTIDRAGSQITVHLWWKGMEVAGESGALDVEVTVTVKQGDPLSRWRINVTNRSKTHGLWDVTFPAVTLAPIGTGSKTNHLTIAKSRGIVVDDPFNAQRGFGTGIHKGNEWPGSLDMQFNALYDDSGTGLYLAAEDGQGYKKRFYITQIPDRQIMAYKVVHYPPNMGYPAENYQMTYDMCIGPFAGDWYDACQVYRKWAIQQRWCQQGPLKTRKDIPKWFKETPLVLKAESAYGEKSVLEMRNRILAVLDYIQMDLPIDWYEWQDFPLEKYFNDIDGIPHSRPVISKAINDGNYPIAPALKLFSYACDELLKAKGYVKGCICAKLYDPGINENSPFAAKAKPGLVLDVHGKPAINKRYSAWQICYSWPWWQQRLKDQVVAMVKNENVQGIYFDTFYGGYYQCFNTEHGHSHGGGNDAYLQACKFSQVVRGGMKKANPMAVVTGEKCAETAIDLLDGFLLYWPVWPEMAPLLAAVYGDYICISGSFVAPESDGFYVQTAALFSEGQQMGRLRFQLNYDDWMAGYNAGSKYTNKMKFLRKLCHYRKPNVGVKYLAYGKLLRPIQFSKPDSMPTFSYNETSRYVSYYKKGLITVPALMNGVFKAQDGNLGIFIVNVTDKPVNFDFELAHDRYEFLESDSFTVTAVDQTAKRGKSILQKGKITHRGIIAGYDVLFLEAAKLKGL